MITQNFQWNSGELKSRALQNGPEDHNGIGHPGLRARRPKELLATPSLTALMVEAALTTSDPLLPEGYVTVGKSTASATRTPPSSE